MKMKIKERFSLTVREGEISELLLKGKSNKEIADLTCVSTETVKSHLQNIYRKLGVKSRLEAVALFLKEQE
jgi:DNA-binding CsgD family transcriptional regulator